jgi:hypothetical protein
MAPYWTKESILNNYHADTPPAEIFQTVCDALGDFYKAKGFSYTSSSRKLTRKDQDLKLEIRFSSSGSNYAGGYVNLEINAWLYSLDLARGDRMKGLLTGVNTPFSKKLEGDFPAGTRLVVQINGEVTKLREEGKPFSELIYNRNVNVYGIDEVLFEQILGFIDNRIIAWCERFADPARLPDLVREMGPSARKELRRTRFLDYVRMKCPDKTEDMERELGVA